MNNQAASKSGKLARNIGFFGIGLCVLCCAVPVIGIVGGAGIFAAVAVFAEDVSIVLLIFSAGLCALWLYKRTQFPKACAADCDCKTEIEHAKSITDLKTK